MKTLSFLGEFNPPHMGHTDTLQKAVEAEHPERILICVNPGSEQTMELCADAFPEAEIDVGSDRIPSEGKILIETDEQKSVSKRLRSRLALREGTDEIPAAVYEKIIARNYYGAQPDFEWLRKQAYALLKPKRIAHVAGCEQEAVQLALRWGESPEDAAVAGILHDCTKKCDLDEQLRMCHSYGIINDIAEETASKLLHAKTGAALAEKRFGVSSRIRDAIRWHTTGKPGMSKLEKIIYLADYVEPTRSFNGVEPLRKLCYEDLDEAMELGLRMSLEDIRSYGEEPYIDTIKAWEYYHELISSRPNNRKEEA